MPGNENQQPEVQRPAAELLYADELIRLAEADKGSPRPGGWRLTPVSVLRFILGDEAAGMAPKFVGSRAFLERCIVALATNRGLMLIGEPGTAKSYLSELLAAAISGDSTLIIPLCSEMEMSSRLFTSADRLVLIASDARLLRAAAVEGLEVFNPETNTEAQLIELIA